MLKRIVLFVLFLSLISVSDGESRVYLDINAPTFVQIPIILPKWRALDRTPPALSAKVYEILANDLAISGFFRVIDVDRLPSHLKDKEGIPNTLSLQEWGSVGGEVLLAGEISLDSEELHLRLKFHLFDLVEEKHLVGKQYEGHLKNLRMMVHRMVDEAILQLTGEKGVNNTKIAYAALHGGGKEIFVADFDGAEVKQITQNRSLNLSPVWSPDNKRIAFTSYLKRNPDVYLIDIDGKNLQRFSYYSGLNASPCWSPDGKQIALMLGMGGKSEIFLIDASGGNPRKLTRGKENELANEASPTWSPDGQEIAFVSDRSGSPQIYIASKDGSVVRRLTYEGSYNTHPAWSPKGDRIAFCGRVGGHFEIFTIAIDGTGLQKLTSNSGNNESPCWSPDGRYIAFSSNRTGGSKIYIMNANGLNQRPLTQSKGGETSPSWSKRFE
ncbi:MAG: Tol-Pal system beta propeller repeat protein TolB [Syntrophaceae bacterium]|nr:Tol-Pal system beta propeller repeat protein TolB [Syntrophaceae bacterium]